MRLATDRAVSYDRGVDRCLDNQRLVQVEAARRGGSKYLPGAAAIWETTIRGICRQPMVLYLVEQAERTSAPPRATSGQNFVMFTPIRPNWPSVGMPDAKPTHKRVSLTS